MGTLKDQKSKRKQQWTKKLGAHIKKLRIERGLTGKDLADKLGSGVYKQHIHVMENGGNPTAFRLKEICDALEISMAEFFELMEA